MSLVFDEITTSTPESLLAPLKKRVDVIIWVNNVRHQGGGHNNIVLLILNKDDRWYSCNN